MYQLIFSTSITVVALATLVSLLLPYFQDQTYCYTSITTLSSSQANSSPNCFSVSSKGIYRNIYTAKEADTIQDGYVIPGLWDGHGHILPYGEFLDGVDLFGSKSLDEVNSRVKAYAEKNPSFGTREEWIRGVGWDQAVFGGIMPTADQLHNTASLYIMLDRVDVHCVWVSSAVLSLLPFPLPVSPPGGEIISNPGPGVFCDNAMDIVLAHYPAPDKAKKQKFIKNAMSALNKVGLVGVADAGVRPQDLRLYEEMAGEKEWTVRVYAMRECEKRNTFCAEELGASPMEREDGMLSVKSVKLFADGALGSWGSALIEPYSDHPWTSGSSLVNATMLKDLAVAWASAGFQVNIHCIGDLANRYGVDAFTAALEAVCPGATLEECQRKRRFRLEHAQIIHPDDQKRIHAIGILPSIQPTHATSDMAYAEDRLGHERTSQEAYRMRSFLDLQPILGSDFPVEPPNPFEGMFAAVARRSPRTGLSHGGKNESWYPQETLSLQQALEGFTKGPAHGAFLEGKAGVIQRGAFADWVVLDSPLEKMHIDDLRTLSVRETWIGGRRVYQRGV